MSCWCTFQQALSYLHHDWKSWSTCFSGYVHVETNGIWKKSTRGIKETWNKIHSNRTNLYVLESNRPTWKKKNRKVDLCRQMGKPAICTGERYHLPTLAIFMLFIPYTFWILSLIIAPVLGSLGETMKIIICFSWGDYQRTNGRPSQRSTQKRKWATMSPSWSICFAGLVRDNCDCCNL